MDPWGFLHFARSLKVVSEKTSKTWPDHLFQKLEINQGGGGGNTWTCEQWNNCAVPGVVFVQRTFGFNLCTIHKYICLRFRLFGERTFKPIRRWVCTLRSRAINVTTSRGNGKSKTKTFSTTSSMMWMPCKVGEHDSVPQLRDERLYASRTPSRGRLFRSVDFWGDLQVNKTRIMIKKHQPEQQD